MDDHRTTSRSDRSPYERPNLGWRCGRAARWDRPCAAGPGPDGSCPHRDGPCRPRRAHHRRLGLLSLGVALWTLAMVVFLITDLADRVGLPSSLDAGPLSPAHAIATVDQGCAACHQADAAGLSGWASVAMRSVRTGEAPLIDQACASCHGFGGLETQPHNVLHAAGHGGAPAAGPTRCVACHAGHPDDVVARRQGTEQSCRACHGEVFGSFPTRHPAFSPTFPHDPARVSRFDHGSHLGKHFTDPRQAPRVPAAGCLGCHEPQSRDGGMRTLGYVATCAACHDAGIARREFTLMRWPEVAPAGRLPPVCGPSGMPVGSDPVSLDPPNALLTWLLASPGDDPAAYAQAVRALARDLVDDGIVPLATLARERLGVEVAPMFQGVSGEATRRVACAWLANREHEPAPEVTAAGWRAEALEIRYAAPAHGDPVLRAWIDALAARDEPADPDEAQRLAAVRDEILVADGPGQCLKCHAIEAMGTARARVGWAARAAAPRPLHRFDHRPHLGAGGAEACAACHLPSAPGDARSPRQPLEAAASKGAVHAPTGLVPMSRETCAACHRPEGAGEGCLSCHVYHQGHALKPRIAAHAR